MTIPKIEEIPNEGSKRYFFVIAQNGDENYQVIRVNTEDSYVPNFSNDEEPEDQDDYGTFPTQERAQAIAKELNTLELEKFLKFWDA